MPEVSRGLFSIGSDVLSSPNGELRTVFANQNRACGVFRIEMRKHAGYVMRSTVKVIAPQPRVPRGATQ